MNQLTQKSQAIELPKMMLGTQWLGQNRDPKVPSPVVDKVKQLVGSTCTIFQRMNDAGDMLRVCTNVQGKDGQRAIGTYIPAVTVDGKPNPVNAALLRVRPTWAGRSW